MSTEQIATPKATRLNRFVSEYLVDFNGKRAAQAAGYSKNSAAFYASKLLKNDKVQQILRDRLEKQINKIDLTSEKVLSELSLLGFSNMLDYITTNQYGDAYIDLSRITREQAAAISEITVDEYTDGRGDEARNVKRTKLKLTDKVRSLELLGRYLKLFEETRNTNINIVMTPQDMTRASSILDRMRVIDVPVLNDPIDTEDT